VLSACLLLAAKLLWVKVGVDVCNEEVLEEAFGQLFVVACARYLPAASVADTRKS
jgi:hypothetical protein